MDRFHTHKIVQCPFSFRNNHVRWKKQECYDVHMDFYQGDGNDEEAIDQNKHNASGDTSRGGGSNFAFTDGSVRFLKYGESLSPENLWAATDQWRNAPSPLEE